MLARRLPGILPPIDVDDAITAHADSFRRRALATAASRWSTTRPFRAPHHTISAVGLVGGGRPPQPGEVTLAHLGVLFLDEVCAFAPGGTRCAAPAPRGGLGRRHTRHGHGPVSRPTAPGLRRQPVPVRVRRRSASALLLPARASGGLPRRLSGPVADRLDMQIDVPRLDAGRNRRDRPAAGEATAAVRARVEAARRSHGNGGRRAINADLTPSQAARDACRARARRQGAAAARDRAALAVGACARPAAAASPAPSPTSRGRTRREPSTSPKPCSTAPSGRWLGESA